MPDQEARKVVDTLLEGMISHFGVLETINTDQGRNFESRVLSLIVLADARLALPP